MLRLASGSRLPPAGPDVLQIAPQCAGLSARQLLLKLASGSRSLTCGPQAEHTGLKVLPLDALHEADAHEGPRASVQAVHVVGDARHVAILIEPLLIQVVCMVPVVTQDLQMWFGHVSVATA